MINVIFWAYMRKISVFLGRRIWIFSFSNRVKIPQKNDEFYFIAIKISIIFRAKFQIYGKPLVLGRFRKSNNANFIVKVSIFLGDLICNFLCGYISIMIFETVTFCWNAPAGPKWKESLPRPKGAFLNVGIRSTIFILKIEYIFFI